jgi:hypothetical protein
MPFHLKSEGEPQGNGARMLLFHGYLISSLEGKRHQSASIFFPFRYLLSFLKYMRHTVIKVCAEEYVWFLSDVRVTAELEDKNY